VWGGTRRPKLCVRRSDLYGYRELYGHKRGKLEFTITKGSWKIYLGTSVSVDLIFLGNSVDLVGPKANTQSCVLGLGYTQQVRWRKKSLILMSTSVVCY
jgi:hypothetical protein